MGIEHDDSRRVICDPAARAVMVADVAARPRIEACGLLIGSASDAGWRIEDAVALRNTHNAPSYFEFDPSELLEQDLRWGTQIVGAYHSHPGGPARPSRIDFDNMKNNGDSPWVWLILSPAGATPLGPVQAGAWHAVTAAAFRVERETVVQFAVDAAADDSGTDG
jgi:proteasome lid subunit RPN8/RPN11